MNKALTQALILVLTLTLNLPTYSRANEIPPSDSEDTPSVHVEVEASNDSVLAVESIQNSDSSDGIGSRWGKCIIKTALYTSCAILGGATLAACGVGILVIVREFSSGSPIGPQYTSFNLVNFRNDPIDHPWSVDEVRQSFDRVQEYFRETSYSQTYLVGEINDWRTLDIDNNTSCDDITSHIDKLSDSDTGLLNYLFRPNNRNVYFIPSVNCGFAGLGQIGRAQTWAIMNGNIDPSIIAHELGHNLGLSHAKLLKCGSSGPIGDHCETVEYGDNADQMGRSAGGHFNAFHKETLRWLDGKNTPKIELISESGHFMIEPMETQSLNTKALKILSQFLKDGSKDFYYVEFRQPIGFDDGLQNLTQSNLVNGILIHRGNDKNEDSSFLLDMNPETETGTDAALEVGRNFTDIHAIRGVIITLNSISRSGANVSVQFIDSQLH